MLRSMREKTRNWELLEVFFLEENKTQIRHKKNDESCIYDHPSRVILESE